jgi:DNA/RNA-binding domain of Phe-tRNA-synthetase-like protein
MATPDATVPGWIDAELAEDFPGLSISCLYLEARSARRSPKAIRERLGELASRINGGYAVHMRQDSVPWAYRVLWRRLGVDPDVDRTPVEALVLERLEHGGLQSRGLPGDALTIATLETGVPIVAFDAERVSGPIGLRPARSGEALDDPLPVGRIVYCDERHPVASLGGRVAREAAVTRRTTRMVLCTLEAAAVARMSVEEALWTAVDILRASGSVVEAD